MPNNDGDPLFLYYFRAFRALYAQLALLKPNLVQECLARDPWKVLVATTLLNKTRGKLAIPVLWKILEKWPDPLVMSAADPNELIEMLRSIGTQNARCQRLITMSRAYLKDPPDHFDCRPSSATSSRRRAYPATPISHLPGTGAYALDSYRIFCTVYHKSLSHEWKSVMPSDKKLIRYLKWKWAFVKRKEWSPSLGVVRPVTRDFLKKLISELRA